MASSDYIEAVTDLRHSVMLHVSVAGDATSDLAMVSVHLLDVMLMGEPEAVVRMRYVSRWLVKRLCDVVIKHAKSIGCDVRHVESRYDAEASKATLLPLLANGLRELNRKNDSRSFEIRDLEGNIL